MIFRSHEAVLRKNQLNNVFNALLACVVLSSAYAAEAYPTKPIRLITPAPPGGATDIMARSLAQKLAEALGQQVVVDNRGGAGGIIGTELAANAAADGYTLLLVSLAHTVNPWLYDLKNRYHPINSFAPVAAIAASPVVLAVNPALPVHSVAELVSAAKAQPGKLQYASAGIGSVTHLAGELFKLAFGVDITLTDQAGVRSELPAKLGKWVGNEMRFCQTRECESSFYIADLTNTTVCPKCGGKIDTLTRVERGLLPGDTVGIRTRYTSPDNRQVFASFVLSGKERASIHRPEVEKKLGVPLKEWRSKHKVEISQPI